MNWPEIEYKTWKNRIESDVKKLVKKIYWTKISVLTVNITEKYYHMIERLIDYHDNAIFKTSIILNNLIIQDISNSQSKLYSK